MYTICFLWKLVIRQFPRGFGRSAECSIDLSQQSTCFGSKSRPKPSESIALTPPHLLASPKCRHKDRYTHFVSLDVSSRTLDDTDLWHDSSPVHDTMSTEIVYFPLKRIFHKIPTGTRELSLREEISKDFVCKDFMIQILAYWKIYPIFQSISTIP